MGHCFMYRDCRLFALFLEYAAFGVVPRIKVFPDGKESIENLIVPYKKKEKQSAHPFSETVYRENPVQTFFREVSEETGLTKLKMIRELKTTYHTYTYKGKITLKPSLRVS